jgi:hypothetical protein
VERGRVGAGGYLRRGKRIRGERLRTYNSTVLLLLNVNVFFLLNCNTKMKLNISTGSAIKVVSLSQRGVTSSRTLQIFLTRLTRTRDITVIPKDVVTGKTIENGKYESPTF